MVAHRAVRSVRLPEWTQPVALAAIGGVLGSCGTLLVLHAAARNWIASGAVATALGVFATFSAVLVALFPIWRKEERRNAAAMAVRTTTLTYLIQLLAYVTVCQMKEGPAPEEGHSFEYEPARRSLDALLNLMPRTEVLDAEEQALLARAISTSEMVRTNASMWTKGTKDAKATADNLMTLVSAVHDRFAAAIGSEGLRVSRLKEVAADVPAPSAGARNPT
jgi:hypothetical protein